MPQMPSLKTQEPLPPSELVKILEGGATAKRILEKNICPAPGDLVGVRLNLNIIKSTGQAVQTIHRATNKMGYKKNQGFYGGEACDYSDVVVLKNAFFNVNQLARHQISSGEKSKFPMASIDGEFVGKDIPQLDECLEVSFNPKKPPPLCGQRWPRNCLRRTRRGVWPQSVLLRKNQIPHLFVRPLQSGGQSEFNKNKRRRHF